MLACACLLRPVGLKLVAGAFELSVSPDELDSGGLQRGRRRLVFFQLLLELYILDLRVQRKSEGVCERACVRVCVGRPRC